MKNHCTILFVTLFACFISELLAQPALKWAEMLTTHSIIYTSALPTQIALDTAGNVYTTGYFNGTQDFDPGPGVYMLSSPNVRSIYILKQNSSGDFLWARQIVLNAHVFGNYVAGAPVAVDLAGNVYVTGFFTGTADFDPGPDAYNIVSTGARSDVFVLKLDTFGNFEWAKSMGSGIFGLFGAFAGCIAVDNSGSLYVTGGFADTIDFDGGPEIHSLAAIGFNDVFVLKMSLDGNFIWAKNIGGIDCQNTGYSISVGVSGNVYISGVFTETVDFDPGAGVNNITATTGGFNTFILKLDSNGNSVWVKRLGGEKSIFGYATAINALEDIYVVGTFDKAIDFDPGSGLHYVNDGRLYVLKLSANGDFKWVKTLDNYNGISVNNAHGPLKLDPFGNVYLTGVYAGPTDFDPGPDSINLTSNGFVPNALVNYADIFLLSLNNDGNFRWVSTIGGNRDDICTAIAIRDAGSICLTGNFTGTVDFDPGPEVTNLTLPALTKDVFIAEWSLSAVSVKNRSGVDACVFPNPANEVIVVNLGEEQSAVQVEVFALDGKRLFQNKYENSDVLMIPFDASPGVYLLRLSNEKGSKSVYKIMKN